MKTFCVLLVVVGVALPVALGCSGEFVGIGSMCLNPVIADLGVGTGTFPISWKESRKRCQAIGSDLAVIDTGEKREAISDYILKGSYSGYPHWVGGSGEGLVWHWINGQSITHSKELWLPHYPTNRTGVSNTLLVPVNEGFYLAARLETDYAPAYICEQS